MNFQIQKLTSTSLEVDRTVSGFDVPKNIGRYSLAFRSAGAVPYRHRRLRKTVAAAISLRRSLQSPRIRTVVIAAILAAAPGSAAPIVIDFESFDDGAMITTQVPGLTFTNGQILTAGISLNEIELPPHSGSKVISDSGGPISILFTTPAVSVSGYFTYLFPLTLAAFDPSGRLVQSSSSLYANNAAVSGQPGSHPNELLQVAAPAISRLAITGDPAGASFALDDLAITAAAPIPEPWALPPLGILFSGLVLAHVCRRGRNF